MTKFLSAGPYTVMRASGDAIPVKSRPQHLKKMNNVVPATIPSSAALTISSGRVQGSLVALTPSLAGPR